MTSTTVHSPINADVDLRSSLARGLRAALHTLELWQERHEQRRALAALTPEELRDIGVSAGDAALEARKPFWQA